MIASTHHEHFILSTNEGVHIVLDEDAVELTRSEVLQDAMSFAKNRFLTRQADGLMERVAAQKEAAESDDDEPDQE